MFNRQSSIVNLSSSLASSSSPEYANLKSKDIEKYEAIKDILLAAGYFRVRISTLSAFDKVVGGLCFCIRNSNAEVDVDVTFEEDPNIGEKIRISENICSALQRMKCPIKLQPVQIQGLDFDVVYQVFQFLIKKVFETREENKEKISNYTELFFSKHYQLPSQTEFLNQQQRAEPFQQKIQMLYLPKRKFKPKTKVKRVPKLHIQSVLLEYGKEFRMKDTDGDDGNSEASDANGASVGIDSNNEMKQNLTSAVQQLSASNLNRMIQTDEILKEQEEFEKKMLALQKERLETGKDVEKYRHKQKVLQLQKQIQTQKKEFLEFKKKKDTLENRQTTLSAELEKYTSFNEKVENKMTELQAKADVDDPIVIRLKKLVAINEALKKQEADFKLNCKRQLDELKEMIAKLETTTEESLKLKQVEKTFAVYQDKLKKVKMLLSKKNRDIQQIQRKIDDIPSRSELTQYEKRFKELYLQIVINLDGTKKYYNIYNTLSTTYEFLQKENSLLNSINDGFKKTIGNKKVSKEYRQWLIDTSRTSLDAVNTSLDTINKKKVNVQQKRDALQEQYSQLVLQQRKYFQTLKEFQDELKKNELLSKAKNEKMNK